MLRQFQKNLRKLPTIAELKLWHYLRDRRFHNFKFRRQQVIKNYIVDFICYEKNLIIEIDGSQHLEQMFYDQARTQELTQAGFQVIRFWNNEVMNQVDVVLEVIHQKLFA